MKKKLFSTTYFSKQVISVKSVFINKAKIYKKALKNNVLKHKTG